MSTYGLSFIEDAVLFKHVKDTVTKYKFRIKDLKEFNSNLIDPIKLTFDSKIYNQTMEELINGEMIRQIDKSNSNHIGYFHQNIFNYIGEGWHVPAKGWDIINDEKNIYVEMKNKHNTMNSSSSQKTYARMQQEVLNNPKAQCFLVEVIAKNSQNIIWKVSMDGTSMSNKQIRRVSLDKFYEIVTGDKEAFKKLCEILPTVITDVVNSLDSGKTESTVLKELKDISPNILKSLYLLSFAKYEGFDTLNI